ncbi:MAG: glycosyltransferase family 4 protein [Pseudomonadota bacterium]
MPDITFWQNIVSPHQSAFLEAVAEAWTEGGVKLICEKRQSAARKAQGWTFEPPEGVAVASLEDETSASKFIHDAILSRDIFVSTGIHSVPVAAAALNKGIRAGLPCYVLAEHPIWLGRAKQLKKLRYQVHAARLAGKLAGLFAYGEMGAQFYKSVGFSPDKVHPFAYTVPATDVMTQRHSVDGLRFVFIGTQLDRKGFDSLIDALISLGDSDPWYLDCLGPSETEPFANALDAGGLADRVTWHGVVPNTQVRRTLEVSDVLVLPSRFDGWGAVVNEALHAGMRAVVSDRCGSCCLVETGSRGQVFREGDPQSLAAALTAEIKRGPPSKTERKAIQAWADDAISAEAMARYFVAILKGEHVAPPWTLADQAGV